MACRKAAYNALTEISEFMEKQAEHAAAAQAKLEAEQRQIWTPPSILCNCCIPWLSDGSEVVGHRTNHHVPKGCSGGCGRAHPRITLEFDDVLGSTAVLSHALDPFVQHFEELCNLGLASRIQSDDLRHSDDCDEIKNTGPPPCNAQRKYQLKGFLLDHGDRLQRSTRFGYHLVKVSPLALSASRRAHDRHAEEKEELERCAKKRRIKAAGYSADERNLFERALQICYEQGSLLNHLNVLDISWMRLSGDRTLAKLAAKLAVTRTSQLRLTYCVSLHGTYDHGEMISFFDGGNFNNVRCGPYSLRGLEERPGEFAPLADDQIISWESSTEDVWLPDTFLAFFLRIRVRLDCMDPQYDYPPEKDCLFQQPIEVGWYHIDLPIDFREETVPEGLHTVPSQQTPNSKVIVQVSPGGLSYRQGRLSIRLLIFQFRHLLGIYARKKLPLAKQHMMDTKKNRPLSRDEKNYVKAIAQAAREAPGSGERTFEGLYGWPSASG